MLTEIAYLRMQYLKIDDQSRYQGARYIQHRGPSVFDTLLEINNVTLSD